MRTCPSWRVWAVGAWALAAGGLGAPGAFAQDDASDPPGAEAPAEGSAEPMAPADDGAGAPAAADPEPAAEAGPADAEPAAPEPEPAAPEPPPAKKEKGKAPWIDLHAPSLSGLGGFGHLITPDAMEGLRAGVTFAYSETDADRGGFTLEGEHASWEAYGAFGFGLGEVALRVPVYQRRRDKANVGGQADEESFGDIELSAKVGVPLGFVTVGGYLRLDIATGEDNEGLGAMREPFPARQDREALGTELELGGALALRPFDDGELKKMSFFANLGFTWAEGAEQTFVYRFGLSYAATETLRFIAYWDGEEHEGPVEHRGSVTLGVQAGVAEVAIVTAGLTVLVDDEFAEGLGLEDVKQLGVFVGVAAAF